MDAIILAGGKGTRVQEIAEGLPKPMMPVCGFPFIDLLANQIGQSGLFQNLIISTGYEAEKIRTHFGKKRYPFQIKFSHEESPLGTGGALLKAFEQTSSSLICLLNGDSYVEIDWKDFVKKQSETQRSVLVLTRVDHPGRYGLVKTDPHTGEIRFFEEKSATQTEPGLINAGVFIFTKKTLLNLHQKFGKKNKMLSLEKDLMSDLLKEGLFSWESSGLFIDIGTHESYREAQIKLKPLMEKLK